MDFFSRLNITVVITLNALNNECMRIDQFALLLCRQEFNSLPITSTSKEGSRVKLNRRPANY